MEDFYINNTSQMESNNSNATSNYNDYDNTNIYYILKVITCIIISIGLPLTLLAIYSLYSQVQNTNVAPIFIINLLISDIIQFCYMIIYVAKPEDKNISKIFYHIYLFGLLVSVGFMVCIALERYLLITWPLWYRFRRTIKISLAVCVIVWTLALVYVLPLYFCVDFKVSGTIAAIFLLVPFPLFIFFLVGTLKALSAAISVPSNEKRRIMGVLVLVLLTYTLLFLPSIICNLAEKTIYNVTFTNLMLILPGFSPLADLILYFFMRKGVIDKLLASLCCCRMDSDDKSRDMFHKTGSTNCESNPEL